SRSVTGESTSAAGITKQEKALAKSKKKADTLRLNANANSTYLMEESSQATQNYKVQKDSVNTGQPLGVAAPVAMEGKSADVDDKKDKAPVKKMQQPAARSEEYPTAANSLKRENAESNQRINSFHGAIKDANNNPLPFANITNRSDNVGTYADAQGRFTL